MRARKWATDENRREIISPERANLRMHYDFKPDENMYLSCENINIYFPLDFIENFYVRNKRSFPFPLPLPASEYEGTLSVMYNLPTAIQQK
jgi:hypothetical protein